MSPSQGITTNKEKEYENKLTYLNEVHQMVVFILGTDGCEEFFERSLHPLGQCPVTHVKSCFGQLLPEGVSLGRVLPLDVMSACLNMNICCPGGNDLRVILDVVYLGHSEDILLWVGVEGTVESDIVHCRFRCLVDLLNEGVDWGVDIDPLQSRVEVSIRDVNCFHHLPSFLRNEGDIR